MIIRSQIGNRVCAGRFRKVGEAAMAASTQPPRVVRWIAERDDTVVGAVERTSRGRYRATNSRGKTVGTYRTLAEARRQLDEKHDSTARQRMDQSRVLLLTGLVALIATGVIAVAGIVLLLVL